MRGDRPKVGRETEFLGEQVVGIGAERSVVPVVAPVVGAMIAKFCNNGQTCVCANRIYVHDAVYDEFAAGLTTAVEALRVGEGTEPGVNVGPLIDEPALVKVESQISDALTKGAKLATGGRRHDRGCTFFTPTVLTEVSSDMIVAREETFGPLAPLFRFKSEEEVLELANATDYGLASYLYSRDFSRVFRIAEALEFGMVGVNTGLISTCEAPFGGIKQSGLGRVCMAVRS